MDQEPRLPVLVFRDLDRRGLARHVDRAVEQIAAGEFRAADVKKLRNAGLYRARLDDTNRLLFKFGEHAGRKVVLVLEVVHNHAYDRARFLGGGTATEEDFESVAGPADVQAADRLRYVHPSSPVMHVLDKPLSFDDAQAAVFGTPLPLIVVGSAGSGKTALTLEKLKTIPGHGLYLTRSSFLVQSARSLYFAHGYENAGQEVDFLSLRELVETIEVPAGREATWADFATFFARVRGGFKLREPHKLYEEIKGVLTGSAVDAPHLDEATYSALGVRQSIFLGEDRRAVFQIFRRWLDHLRASGLYDANMVAWERVGRAEARYDFLVIDEVQDITNVELRLALALLRDKRNFLLCGDSNQIVHPNLFSWARVKSLFWTTDARPDESPLDRIHVLAANYRNTQAVTAIANRLLRVKQSRFGSIDRESNYLVECVSDEQGHVDLRADTPALRREIDEKTRRSVHHAVVVLRDEDKAAAREAFSTPLVFAVHEAKGLEYENVILFRMVSSAPSEFRECTAGVGAADLEGDFEYARARDKTDKSLDAYKFYVNALYVAVTRAQKSLLIVESEADHPLFDLLTVRPATGTLVLDKSESSQEDWQREARRLELQGKTEQAEQIRRELLANEAVPWQIAGAGAVAGLRARALGDGARDKAAQQLLFEYGLTYDLPMIFDALAEVGFRHARKPDSGREFIERTHYEPYQVKRSSKLEGQRRRHGIDFRNPLNETPLMVAARTGRFDLVGELLEAGADPELRDSAGRTPLRIALRVFSDRGRMKPHVFAEVYRRLAIDPMKVKVGNRMTKLDPRAMEWFLLNFCMVEVHRRLAGGPSAPRFTAPVLERALSHFPDAVLPPHRKKRAYLSAMLAKNEFHSNNPYNRRLFLRVDRGVYVLNPAVDLGQGDGWITLFDVLELPSLFEMLGRDGESRTGWYARLNTRVRGGLGEVASAPPAGETPLSEANADVAAT
jgi:hypothetical protein